MGWQYFNDTGIVGGTANMADQTFYIDSYKGSDLNVGSNAAPFQTIQKALDVATQGTFYTQGADFILAGYFQEGNFGNQRNGISLIAEGDVVIDGSLNTHFQLSLITNIYRSSSFNYNQYNTKAIRKYGRLTFQNYSDGVMFGHSNNAGGTIFSKVYNTTFIDCQRVGQESVYQGLTTGASYITDFKGCKIKDCISVYVMNRGSATEHTYFYNNTLINCETIIFDQGADSLTVQSCYFDSLTKMKLDSPLLGNGFDNCHIEGTLAGKITIDASVYTNNELAQVGFPTFNTNGRLSTDANEFNNLAEGDYTYPNTAVNATAGYLGTYIGAFGIADGAQAIADANWVADVKVDKTTVPTEAVLIGTPEGIIETTNGIHIVTGSKPKKLKRLILPGEINDYDLGKVIDTTKSVSGGTPSIRTVEIDFSSDSGSTYHGSWVEVPINGEPKIDNAGVGNGSPLYDATTGKPIVLTHIKYRITLRNDEEPII